MEAKGGNGSDVNHSGSISVKWRSRDSVMAVWFWGSLRGHYSGCHSFPTEKKDNFSKTQREGTAYVLNKVHIACLLSASMIITSRKVQVRLSPRIEKGGEHKVACLAEEWLATDSCWDKESQISLRMNLMMAQPHSSERPHFQEYISSINFTCWVFIFLKRDTKREGQNG